VPWPYSPGERLEGGARFAQATSSRGRRVFAMDKRDWVGEEIRNTSAWRGVGGGTVLHKREIEKREGAGQWALPWKEIQNQNINFIQI
jgi:hypothetical protein